MYQCYFCSARFEEIDDLASHAGLVHGTELELRDYKVFAREFERAYNNHEIGPLVPVPKQSIFDGISHLGNSPIEFLK